MQVNKNLKNIKPYTIDSTPQNTQRLHCNESQSPILPLATLTQGLFDDLNFYPEDITQDLTNAAARFYNSSHRYTIPTNGSDEGLDLIIRTMCNHQDSIAILKPTFGMYKQYASLYGANVLEFNLDEDFAINSEKLIDTCLKLSIKILFVPNPLAPTGGKTSHEKLLEIVKSLPNIYVVIDEAYIEFSEEQSMIKHVPYHENLIVTRTLSKFFGLAGIRLGFIFSQMKNEIMKVKSPYNVNKVTAKIALNMFENITQSVIIERFDENIRNKKRMIEWLSQFDEIEKIYNSYANFLFIKLKCNSHDFSQKLLHEHRVKIKDFSGTFSNFCRISVSTL